MTPAESMKDEGPPLTAADLDRLAHEWSERRVVTNSVEHREKADRARLERLKTALPSLLALARRGLEAERLKVERDEAERAGITAVMFALREAPWNPGSAVGMVRLVGIDPVRIEPVVLNREQVQGLFEALEQQAVPLLENRFRTAYEAVRRYEQHEGLKHDLAAALAEVERMRGQLACAKRFDLPCGAEVYMSKKDNANTYLLWARGDFSDARYNTLDAAWSAAEQAQAGQAAKQGGEGDSHEAR